MIKDSRKFLDKENLIKIVENRYPKWITTLEQKAPAKKKDIILIAEDCATQAKLFKQIIKSIYPTSDIIITKNGKDAISLIKNNKNKIILLVLDLTLADIDGSKVLSNTPSRIPTVVLTASSKDRSKELLNKGAKIYLQKGFQQSFKKFVEILSELKNFQIN